MRLEYLRYFELSVELWVCTDVRVLLIVVFGRGRELPLQ